MMWSFFSRDSSKDFPYDIGEPVAGFENHSIWTLHKAKRKGTQEEVSVFVFDLRSGSDAKCELAKAALKRLKTLRHPSILQFLDSLETDKLLYVATEYVEPLGLHIAKLSADGPQKDLYLAWGIFQITVSDWNLIFVLFVYLTASLLHLARIILSQQRWKFETQQCLSMVSVCEFIG